MANHLPDQRDQAPDISEQSAALEFDTSHLRPQDRVLLDRLDQRIAELWQLNEPQLAAIARMFRQVGR